MESAAAGLRAACTLSAKGKLRLEKSDAAPRVASCLRRRLAGATAPPGWRFDVRLLWE